MEKLLLISASSERGFWGQKKIPGWNEKAVQWLLLSFQMLATTCIYSQVMVIHQLPEGAQIMMVATVEGVAGKSMCDVASGSLQPLKSVKTCTPSPSVLL